MHDLSAGLPKAIHPFPVVDFRPFPSRTLLIEKQPIEIYQMTPAPRNAILSYLVDPLFGSLISAFWDQAEMIKTGPFSNK